jgi:hypothetical protein
MIRIYRNSMKTTAVFHTTTEKSFCIVKLAIFMFTTKPITTRFSWYNYSSKLPNVWVLHTEHSLKANSMEQSPPSEAKFQSASQEIPRLLWKTTRATTSHTISLRSILILSSHLRLCLPSCLFLRTKTLQNVFCSTASHYVVIHW